MYANDPNYNPKPTKKAWLEHYTRLYGILNAIVRTHGLCPSGECEHLAAAEVAIEAAKCEAAREIDRCGGVEAA